MAVVERMQTSPKEKVLSFSDKAFAYLLSSVLLSRQDMDELID